MRHVAVLQPRYLQAFLSGKKLIEARLLRRRVPPFGVVRASDTIYVKCVGQPISHVCTVGWVIQKEEMGKGSVEHLRRQYADAVNAPISFWRSYLDARHAVLVRLMRFSEIDGDDPIHAAHEALRVRNPRAGWFVVEDEACAVAA